MIFNWKLAAASVVALLSPLVAHAAPDQRAYELYVAGDYDAAVEAAVEAHGAENLTLAARSLNAVAYILEDRKESRRTADRALDYAESAIEEDPDLVEAHLQAAIGLSLRGANMAPVRAFMLNIPRRARGYIDQAVALDPSNAWALSTSAAWRLEVARRGGGKAYGADPVVGFAEFEKARALDPGNISIAYECALRLFASERAEWRLAATECLAAALVGEAHTHFEEKIKARARALAAAVKAGPEAEAAFIEAQP